MNYKPMYGDIIAKETNPLEDSSLVADVQNEPIVTATVVALNQGDYKYHEKGIAIHEPMAVGLDDTIKFFRESAHGLELDGENYLVVNQHDILVIQN